MAQQPSVDTNKFNTDFQNHPNFNAIVQQINQSPTLVETINNFTGKVNQGALNSGGYFDPDLNIINIPIDWVSDCKDPTFRGQFITMLGHETGHAVLPGGNATQAVSTPQESVTNDLNGEGVALTNEYKISRELGVSMWSDSNGSLKAAYDVLATTHGVNTPEFNEAGKQLGANATKSWNPSNATNLNYEQYYLAAAVVGMCDSTPGDFNSIDWQAAKPNDITFTNNPDGSCTYTGSLPTLSGGATGTGSLSGPVSINVNFPANNLQEKPSSQELSPEVQALHDKLGEALHPKLAALNVSKNHADAMVSTHTLDCVKAGISAEDVKMTGVEPKSNLISSFHSKSEWVGVYTDAVAASRNNPEQSLQHAQQQLEQQPAQEQQRQQQLEQQTKERSGQSMSM